MPTPPRYFVWEWLDNSGQPKFLGKGRAVGEAHPADVMWANRSRMNSPLGHWLQSLEQQPQRSSELSSCALYETVANALFTQRREALNTRNVALLSSRPYGTKAGGGYARAVVDPAGDLFASVRDAAADHGCDPATITRRCNNPKSNWRYVS